MSVSIIIINVNLFYYKVLIVNIFIYKHVNVHCKVCKFTPLALTRHSDIPRRLKMIDIVANFYRSVLLTTPDQLVDCVYLTLNSLAPAYEGTEIGIGEGVLVKCIAQSTGESTSYSELVYCFHCFHCFHCFN